MSWKARSSLSSKTAMLWPLEVMVSLTGCVRRYARIGLEVGMHSVLARPQIHRTDGQPFHHRPDLFQRKAIGAGGIAIAESAREIALVGEAQPERNPIGRARDK